VTNRHLLAYVQPHTAGLITDEKLARVDALQPLAAELGCTLPQLAVAWAASNPDVSSVFPGRNPGVRLTASGSAWMDAVGSCG